MGALYRGVCYPAEADAQVQACSSVLSVQVVGSDVVTLACTGVSGGSLQLARYVNGSLQSASTQTIPSFPPCDYDGGTQLALGFFSVGLLLLVVVFVARHLARLFWGNHETI